jgi:hypothetical protein
MTCSSSRNSGPSPEIPNPPRVQSGLAGRRSLSVSDLCCLSSRPEDRKGCSRLAMYLEELPRATRFRPGNWACLSTGCPRLAVLSRVKVASEGSNYSPDWRIRLVGREPWASETDP